MDAQLESDGEKVPCFFAKLKFMCTDDFSRNILKTSYTLVHVRKIIRKWWPKLQSKVQKGRSRLKEDHNAKQGSCSVFALPPKAFPRRRALFRSISRSIQNTSRWRKDGSICRTIPALSAQSMQSKRSRLFGKITWSSSLLPGNSGYRLMISNITHPIPHISIF